MKTKLRLLLLLLISLNCGRNKEAVLLRLRYKKGDEEAFIIKLRFYCSESAHINTELDATYTADSIINNGTEYRLSAKLDKIKTDIKIEDFLPGGVVEQYDSEKDFSAMSDDERELDKKYEAIMNPYYAISFNNEGIVVKPFTLYGKTAIPPFSPNLVQVPFPKAKMKVGDSWRAKMSSFLIHPDNNLKRFNGSVVFTYKIAAITPDQVTIHVDLTGETGVHSTNSLSINGEGQYIIDRANGRVITARIDLPFGKCENAVISILRR